MLLLYITTQEGSRSLLHNEPHKPESVVYAVMFSPVFDFMSKFNPSVFSFAFSPVIMLHLADRSLLVVFCVNF